VTDTAELERNWKALKKGYEAARDAHMEDSSTGSNQFAHAILKTEKAQQ